MSIYQAEQSIIAAAERSIATSKVMIAHAETAMEVNDDMVTHGYITQEQYESAQAHEKSIIQQHAARIRKMQRILASARQVGE